LYVCHTLLQVTAAPADFQNVYAQLEDPVEAKYVKFQIVQGRHDYSCVYGVQFGN
jgi:hypothetical protein